MTHTHQGSYDPQSLEIVHFVTRSDVIGGVHIHIIDLCLESISRGLNVCVIAGGSTNSPLEYRLSELSIPFYRLPFITNSVSPASDFLVFSLLRCFSLSP